MEVELSINDINFKVNPATTPINTSLNTFIRDHAQLKGTKFMCLEGGCGACIVTATGLHPVTKEKRSWAVNSCLAPIFSCHNWEITTVEGIGDKVKGYHAIQSRLAKLNGTQCGYCSPGMVMNMYSLLEGKNGKISMEEIENSFGGNICRCTGYRPILDAFKTLAVDASIQYTDMVKDIEDLTICPESGQQCAGRCHSSVKREMMKMVFDDNGTWIKVTDIKQLFDAIATVSKKNYMLVAGNTAHGVYRRNPNINSFIDINDVVELRSHSIGNDLTIGGNVNLTELMDILSNAASTNNKFGYAKHLVTHIDLVANVPVRNSGTIAGNLSIKHQHNEFPSDVFLLLETVGAKLTIADSATTNASSSLQDFLKIEMKNKVILNVSLPQLDNANYLFRSYKIMPRAQNAHAYVNAGFLVELAGDKVVSARICFGGIDPAFVHASQTELSLIDKDLFSTETLKAVIESLSTELNPDWVLPDASPAYRKNLAISLFYKFILDTCPDDKVKKVFKSGGEILMRTLSSGRQVYDTIEKNYPLTKPIKKLESLVQCSGEAQYVNDIPKQHNEAFCAFVEATEALATIGGIDAKDALKYPGVIAFFSFKDIPGKNTFVAQRLGFQEDEEIFVKDIVKFYGQPVGMIVANTTEIAIQASKLVKVTYIKSDKKLVVTLRDAISELSNKTKTSDVTEPIASEGYLGSIYNMIFPTETKKIVGSFAMGGQYHFFMETLQAVCIPIEDGMDIYSTTQWMDLVQVSAADCLNVSVNSINVIVRRLGGGYGGKISRSSHVACAAALAAKLLNRPIRFILTIETTMGTYGKRYGCVNDYNVDVENSGKINKMKNTYTEDGGCTLNEQVTSNTDELFMNCYNTIGWVSNGKTVKTDAPSNTWCRAPGTTEGLAMIENILEHIAYDLKLSPLAVRLANIESDGVMKKIIEDFLTEADYENRIKEIEAFNNENRWRKRGIAFTPMKYPQEYFGSIPVLVSIYQGDGSVAVTHGGIEMGQGINTKVAQVAAYTLGVPLESIIVKPSNTVAAPNSIVTGGSMTSEAVSHAVMKACEILRTRIDVVRKDMETASWKDVIAKCYQKYIDLSATYMYNVTQLKTYNTFGVSCAEVEVDILTGNLLLKRVDILEDTGESMSPLVDIGQVEGAFIMGIGYWLQEKLVYHRTTGELLTNRTWNYKPPGAKDIPIDFRVKFLQKSPNPNGVLRSKATGEPATCMSIVVYFAVKNALKSARKDAGLGEEWFELATPATPEEIFIASGNCVNKYEL